MNRQLRRRSNTIVCALFLGLGPWAACGARAAIECTQSAIQAMAPSSTTILSATTQSDPVPYCDVRGYVTTMDPRPNQVNFELGLPGAWNGRFLFVGNGGFGGSFDFPSVLLDNLTSFPLLTEVSAGFATAITDTGHQGDFLDGSWALNDRAKQDDWLFRGVHVAAVTGKAITRRFYGREARSYFAGCSDGGREGLVEAQRYPADFDGIAAGDPALGPVIPGYNWNQEHLTATADNYIPPNKLALVDAAVMSSCDAADGVADGLIQDPRTCHFDPATLLCTAANTSTCFAPGQVAALKSINAGATTADGRRVYSGFSRSDPAGDDGWSLWITGFVPPDALGTAEPWNNPGLAPWQFLFQDQVLKFFVFGDPEHNSLSFNINSDLSRTQEVMNRDGSEGTNPNLSAFRNRGGKLILYHGWSDPAVSPLETVRYYTTVVQQQDDLRRTEQFARLFMAPGMRHCIGSGPGPNAFDPLTPLIDWVERDKAPKQIMAAHFLNNDPSTGVVTRTMPLCPFPEVAGYKGGDVNQASSWNCHRPED